MVGSVRADVRRRLNGSQAIVFVGIVAAHVALGAAWVENETAPHLRTPVVSCSNSTPGALPDFTPRRELFAMEIVRVVDEGAMRP